MRQPSVADALLRSSWRWSGERILWVLLAAVIFVISILPLLYTINAAFYAETQTGLSRDRSLTAVLNVYFGLEYLGYLGNALFLAAVVTVLSLVAGVGMAICIARTDLPGKKALDLLIIMPLFLSPFTGLIAWIMLGSQRTGFINVGLVAIGNSIGIDVAPLINIWTFAGVVWILFLFFCPFAYLFTIGSLRAMDASLEEAARIHGATPIQVIARVTLPMAVPSILASGILIFVLAAEMYTIPGIIGSTAGFTTLPWRIYGDSMNIPVRRAHAAAAGTMLLWITIFGIWLQTRITRNAERYVTVAGKGFKGRPLALGPWKWLVLAAIGIYIASAVILPFVALVISSLMKYSARMITADIFTLLHYQQIFTLQDIRSALWNTSWLAVVSGVICVSMGLLVSFADVRRPSLSTRLVAFLAVLPVAVPGLVYGIGLLWVYIGTPVYGTPWILLLAYVAKFLPYGVVVSRSAVLQIHPELEQSARMSGATSLVALRRITAPLLKPTLIAILFFVMLMSIKELSASVLLYSQRSQVLSVLTWHYMDTGNYQFAAAVGVLQTLMMVALIVLTRVVFRVRLESAFSK